jgi:hypothetical protein
MEGLGRLLIVSGVVLVVAGLLVAAFGRVPGLGNLPGDITVRRDGFTFYFPLATCILISLLLTLILWFIRR